MEQNQNHSKMCLELSIMVLVGVFDKASESVLHLSPSLALPFPCLSFMNEHRGHLHFQFNLQCWVGTARLCVRYSGILLIRQNSILITHVTIKRCHFLRACLELEQPRGQSVSRVSSSISTILRNLVIRMAQHCITKLEKNKQFTTHALCRDLIPRTTIS